MASSYDPRRVQPDGDDPATPTQIVNAESRTLSEPAPKALDGAEGAKSPFFSPDGLWLGFFADSRLRKIAVDGAGLQTLADAAFPRGGAWGSNGCIYFAPTYIGGLWRVPDGGGPAEEVTKKDL